MSKELKPCPFCGGKMEPTVMCYQHPYDQSYMDWLKEKGILPLMMTGFNSGYVVRCYHCGAESAERHTKKLAAEMWNRRADKVVEQLEKLKKAEQDRIDDCDENGCGDGEQIYDDGRSQGRYEAFGKAIEIVKGGGADGN